MAAFLPEAVQSVFDNDYLNVELIIVDDGSEDKTLQTAKELAHTARSIKNVSVEVISISHGGKAAALNAGLDIAKGDYITFLDADDKLPSKSLSLRMKKIKTDKTDVALGEFEVFSDSEVTGRRKIPTENISKLIHKFLYRWKTPFHLNGMLIKREIIALVGPFDENLYRGQEKDYNLRLLKLKPAISFIYQSVYCYRKYRTVKQRLLIRLKTFKFTVKLVAKHTSGVKKAVVLSWNIVLEVLKLIFNIFGRYKR